MVAGVLDAVRNARGPSAVREPMVQRVQENQWPSRHKGLPENKGLARVQDKQVLWEIQGLPGVQKYQRLLGYQGMLRLQEKHRLLEYSGLSGVKANQELLESQGQQRVMEKQGQPENQWLLANRGIHQCRSRPENIVYILKHVSTVKLKFCQINGMVMSITHNVQ